MKKIYLKDINSNWKEFNYELLSELSDEFKTRNITIEAGATIGVCATIGARATIGAGATIEADAMIGAWATIGADANIGARATIEAGAKIGARASIGARAKIGADATIGARATIGEYNSFFAVNLYKYTCGAWIENRGEIIQLGCFTRTRKEWEEDFWNNEKEFPNDNSDKSNARLRAFKTCCFFLDSLKNN